MVKISCLRDQEQRSQVIPWFPIIAAVSSVLAFGPDVFLYGNLGVFMLQAVTVPLISLGVLIAVIILFIYRQWKSACATLLSYVFTCLFFFCASYPLHITGRWILFGGQSKAAVLSRPQATDGELKHVIWDGWGMAGQDTDAYLVFDPSDTLRAKTAYASLSPDAARCDVWKINRLAKGWYNVVFYTNTGWEHCYWK